LHMHTVFIHFDFGRKSLPSLPFPLSSLPAPLDVGSQPVEIVSPPPSAFLSPLRSRSPLRLGGLGERRHKLPRHSGSALNPASKRILVHFRHKFAPFLLLKMANNFLCLLSIKRMFL